MNKIIKKVKSIKNKNKVDPSARITGDTVAEHRAIVLAGGRKYKYPMQYARRKLVFNATAIGLAALLIAIVIGWWRLYPQQDTSDFMYKITRLVPVPVANVDGYNVLYSDYLMKYKSSTHYLEQKEQVDFSSSDGKKQLEYIKSQSIDDAVADAYGLKLANKLDISVSDSEIDAFIKAQRMTDDGEISEQTYNTVILDYYGWTTSEYRHVTKDKLIRQKVAYAVDEDASNAANSIVNAINTNNSINFSDLASNSASSTGLKITYSKSGWLPKTNQDGGVSSAAAELEKGAVSSLIKSNNGNGYYIIRLIDINDSQVSYEYINIPLSKFSNDLNKLKNDKKVQYYITLPEN